MTLVSARILETAAITVTNAAQSLSDLGLSDANLAIADIAMITVEDDCRFTFDSVVVPTASFGHFLVSQLDREFPGRVVINDMQLIRVGGSDVSGIVTLAKL